MAKLFIINAHQPYPFSEGKLNQLFVDTAVQLAEEAGHEVRISKSAEAYEVEQELENHQWADLVLLQSPVNWMGVPWSFKKYMDEVYTAGMAGALCQGDGRRSEAPTKNYGAGGTLTDTRYMLSLTFNAPAESFNDSEEYLFQGKSVDDLFFPMHMNFRFFGMQALPTFASFDVMKNPSVDADVERFKSQLSQALASLDEG